MAFYELSEKDKEKLRKPRGKVLKDKDLVNYLEEKSYDSLIAVGDRVSEDISKSSIKADVSILDGRIENKDIGKDHINSIKTERTFKIDNPAGKITSESWRTVRKCLSLNCRSKIVVNGEEDLLALPATLFASKNSVIVYGHWRKGAIVMEANEENKKFVENIVDRNRSDHLILGGSWDIFHSGHKYMILTALDKGKKVDIGITSDKMLDNKLGESVFDSFEIRKKRLEHFISDRETFEEFNFIKIDDIYGNAVKEGEDLLVASENIEDAEKINGRRESLGKEKINVDVIRRLKCVDGKPISCSRIRKGEIDKNGLLKN